MLPLLLLFLQLSQPATQAASRPTALADQLAMTWRPIGPFRGGRVAAVTGVVGQPRTFWFGGTGGGVWKTSDGGASWRNMSDTFFGGSIGAVAVSASDPNVVYVGGGEVTVRGNVSHGDGVWKSSDAGRTWTHMGLADTRHIPRIRIHPQDPELVYAAALGHLYGPNAERGVYRSKDGGRTWTRVLFVNDQVGACDLCLDPSNPRILFASTWRVRRTPWTLDSGGEGSGLWRSADGGDTWQELSRNKGLPKAPLGIIGVAVSPANPDRVWAMVEAEEGGVFRSDDGGRNWTRTNADRNLRQRAWYYSRIYADPKDQDRCYVVNVSFHVSKDGGKTFTTMPTPHGDNHDLWIAPEDPRCMIEGNDGGANVTYDGGQTWSPIDNQPTAQFYRVTTDTSFPYRILGAQQDNSTVRIKSRSAGGAIGVRDWESTAGGESGWLAPHPKDPEIVFGGSYGGYLERQDHRTGSSRLVNVWPDNPMGMGAVDHRYRFQWNFPILFSPHAPHALYTAGNVLFRSLDQGQSWTAISPDLSRNDASKLGPSGGPITKDNTGVETYCTIFCVAESPVAAGVLWAGTDDGLVHVSRDGGARWENVTPPGLPTWAQINSVEADPTDAGAAYVAATCYKSDDFRPWLYRTRDHGRTWKQITDGIAADHFTRVVRRDPARKGLLFAGTERGLYVSFDDGGRWERFQRNLPLVPITDLAWKDGDLIAATQGRSFWVLDDLTPIEQWSPEIAAAATHLFRPRPAWRVDHGSGVPRGAAGQNPPAGAVVWFWLAEPQKDAAKEPAITLEFTDASGRSVRRFSTKAKDDEADGKLTVEQGLNRFVWDLRWPAARSVPGMILWGGGLEGPRTLPGAYTVTLSVGEQQLTQPLELKVDPRSVASAEDLRAQFEFLLAVRDKLTETHEAILTMRDVRMQLASFNEREKDQDPTRDLREKSDALQKQLTQVEEALYQTKNQSSQDPLNFPIRLNNRLSALVGTVAAGDWRPTDQAVAVKTEICTAIDAQLKTLGKLLGEDLAAFNRMVKDRDLPRIQPRRPGR